MTTQDFLQQKLADNGNKEFYISAMYGTQPTKWTLYPSMKYEEEIREINAETHKKVIRKEIRTSNIPLSRFNLRQILPQEVIWDIDPPKTTDARDQLESAKKQGEKITLRMRQDNITWSVWWTGNKGLHIQTTWPELRNYSDADRLFLKRELIKKYAWDCDYDLKTATSKCLIQLEDTPHRKTLKNKQKWAEYDSGIPNILPADIIAKYAIKQASVSLRKTLKKDIQSEVKGTLKELLAMPKCMQWLHTTTLPEGNRDNALFSLISHLKHHYHKDELVEEVEKWVERHNNFLNTREIECKIEKAIGTPHKTSCHRNQDLMKDLNKTDLCKDCIHRSD